MSFLLFAGVIFCTVFAVGVSGMLMRVVHIGEGHAAVLERFGRFVGVLEPGTHWLWTPIHSLRRVRHTAGPDRKRDRDWAVPLPPASYTHDLLATTEQSVPTETIQLRTLDGLSLRVRFAIYFTIVDVRAAVYNSSDYLEALRQRVHRAFQDEARDDRLVQLAKRLRAASPVELTKRLDTDRVRAELGLEVARIDLLSLVQPPELDAIDLSRVTSRIEMDAQRELADVRHANELRVLKQTLLLEAKRAEHERALVGQRTVVEIDTIKQLREQTGESLEALSTWRASERAVHWQQ